MKKKSPFYKTGPLFSVFGGMLSPTGKNQKKENEVTSHTEENNASLGRSTRQRKIDNLKGKLKDVKAKTMSLASESKKTGDAKEVMQKDMILGKHDQASRIEKRSARKEGRQERKAIRQSLKGKENRGERRKQIILSRQNQYKKRKAIIRFFSKFWLLCIGCKCPSCNSLTLCQRCLDQRCSCHRKPMSRSR